MWKNKQNKSQTSLFLLHKMLKKRISKTVCILYLGLISFFLNYCTLKRCYFILPYDTSAFIIFNYTLAKGSFICWSQNLVVNFGSGKLKTLSDTSRIKRYKSYFFLHFEKLPLKKEWHYNWKWNPRQVTNFWTESFNWFKS